MNILEMIALGRTPIYLSDEIKQFISDKLDLIEAYDGDIDALYEELSKPWSIAPNTQYGNEKDFPYVLFIDEVYLDVLSEDFVKEIDETFGKKKRCEKGLFVKHVKSLSRKYGFIKHENRHGINIYRKGNLQYNHGTGRLTFQGLNVDDLLVLVDMLNNKDIYVQDLKILEKEKKLEMIKRYENLLEELKNEYKKY